jgi:hypothetical protein
MTWESVEALKQAEVMMLVAMMRTTTATTTRE